MRVKDLLAEKDLKDSPALRQFRSMKKHLVINLTLRNLYKRNVNQLVSIFSATDSVLTQKTNKTNRNEQ